MLHEARKPFIEPEKISLVWKPGFEQKTTSSYRKCMIVYDHGKICQVQTQADLGENLIVWFYFIQECM